MQDKSKKSFERSGSTKINIRFEDDLLAEIYFQLPDNPNEKLRHRIPKIGLSEWVKDACRKKLNG